MKEWVRRSSRGTIRWTARGVGTDSVARRSALVLAPHPDDETLGCGATIMHKVAAGTQVTVLVVTDGSNSHRSPHLPPARLAALRRTEMAEAAARLGLPADAVRWAGIVDGTVAEHEDELTDLLVDTIRELQPDEVYSTCADEPHGDHAAVGRAARRAVPAAGGETRLLEYPVWLWRSWPLRRHALLRSMLDAAGLVVGRRVIAVPTGRHRDGKLHAMRAHSSQLQRPETVPAGEDWQVLPAHVLDAAADRVELFFQVPHQRVRAVRVVSPALVPVSALADLMQFLPG